MKSEEKFKLLLLQYLKGNLSESAHNDFFQLLSSGKYDDITDSHMDLDIEELNDQVYTPEQLDLSAIIYKTDKDDFKADSAKTLNTKIRIPVKKIVLSLVAIIVLIFISTYLFTPFNKDKFFKGFVRSNTDKVVNNTQKPMSFNLPDGSRITLLPYSSIFFSRKAFTSRREVYMKGDAKFDIRKNPAMPFYVFNGCIITKVLGTSFIIRTNTSTGNIEVEVLRGKVQVYENEKTVKSDHVLVSTIVTPNQKAIYKNSARLIETAISDNPVPVEKPEDANGEKTFEPASFIFKEDKVAKVLGSIHAAYHIDIIVYNTAIYNCVFSGDITKASLYNKLKLVCTAINCDYRVSGTKIYIDGKGCN